MAQTYTRQSSFADGDTITAALFNDEYNQLVNAFAYSSSSASSTGHRHDGTAGQGGNIPQIGDLDFLNKIVVDDTNNRWGFYVEVSSAAVEQIRLQDGALLPVTDSDVDLGTSSLYFKDAYIDSITTTGNVDVGGNLTVTGTTTFNGGTLTLGDAADDNVVFGADVNSNIIPNTDNTYDLGSSSQEWKDLYIDGTANIDTLSADTAAIGDLTSGRVVLAGTSGELEDSANLTFDGSTLALTGAATVSTNLTVSGNTTLGNAATDTVTVTADVASNLIPSADSTYSLGDSSNYWSHGYIDAITTTGNVSVGGNLTVTGTTTFNGGTLTLGDAADDNVVFGADVNSNIIPNTDNTYDLGSSSQEWKDLYVDGVAYLDGINFNGTAITSTAAELNILDGVTSTAAEINLLDGVTATTAELNILDGVTSTATELNIVDGNTSATSTTLADADRVVVNDGGTMVQVALTDFETYFESALDTLSNVTTVGALNAGSITSGFGAIDNGSSAITTTGTVTYGSLSDGTITITAFADEDDMSSDSATLVPTQQSVKAYVDSQVTAQDLDLTTDSGTIAIDLDSETLTITGGTGIDTSAATNTVTLALDLNEVTTETSIAQDDFVTMVDATDSGSGKITFSNLEDTIFGNVSGDIAIAAGGAATIQANSVALGTDTTGDYVGTVTAGTGLTSTGATSGEGIAHSLSVDASQTQITAVGTLSSLTVSGDVTVDTSTLKVDSTNNRVGIGNASPDVSLDVGSVTDAIHVPVGTTAQRPASPTAGYFRYNSTTGDFEGYTDAWGAIAGAGGTAPVVDTMTGDGSDTTLTLTSAPVNENATVVTIDGVVQHKDTYSVSSNTLTFSEAPPNGTAVECITWVNTTVNSALLVQDSDGDTQIQVEESSDEDKIRFDIAGTEEMVMDATGIVINDGSNDRDFRIESNGNANRFFVDGGSNSGEGAVVVGHNASLGQHRVFQVTGTTPDTSGMEMFKYSNDASGPTISLSKSRGGSIGTAASVSDNDVIGAINWFADDGTDTSNYAAVIHAEIDGTPGSNDTPGALVFSTTADGSNSVSERMRIDSSGNVGIGTTSPQQKLQVEDGNIYIRGNTAGEGLLINDSTSSSGTYSITREGSGATGYLKFGTPTNETHSFIFDGGNVGIGTTSPDSTLHVKGAADAYLTLEAGATDGNTALLMQNSGGTQEAFLLYDTDDNNMQFGVNSAERMRIDSSGNLIVGDTAFPSGSNSCFGAATGGTISTSRAATNTQTHHAFLNPNGTVGSITTNASATAYNTSSDARLKDVTGSARGLEVINALNPVAYNWKADGNADEGLIAQEVLDIVPNAVSGSEEDMYQMDYSKLVVYLVAGMKEQQTIIEDLKARIETLEG